MKKHFCPKCGDELKLFVTKSQAQLLNCSQCGTSVIGKRDLVKSFNDNVLIKQKAALVLEKAVETDLKCSGCEELLDRGFLSGTDLELEDCASCNLFVFDKKEFSQLFDILENEKAIVEKSMNFQEEELIATDKNCPVCKDKPLYQFGEYRFATTCLECEGILTKVETLEKLINKSLFSPIMFTERPGQGTLAICRKCHYEQDASQKVCLKCEEPLEKVNCISCNSKMTEYDLQALIIERCIFCNDVWLDGGEFQKLIHVLPDFRRHYEKLTRKAELTSAAVRGATQAVMTGIDETRRRVMLRTGLIYSLYFLNKY